MNRKGRRWLEVNREKIRQFILERQIINEEREIGEFIEERWINVVDVMDRVYQQEGIIGHKFTILFKIKVFISWL